MIRLTLAWFVFIYLTVFLAGILIFWIRYEMVRKRSSFTASRPLQCRLCGASLAISSSTDLVSCPACGSLNEPNFQGGL